MDEISRKLSELSTVAREPSPVTRLVLERRQEIEAAVKRGASVARIASVLNVNPNTLAGVLRRAGIGGKRPSKRSPLAPSQGYVPLKQRQIEKLRQVPTQPVQGALVPPRRKIVLEAPGGVCSSRACDPQELGNPDSKY